MIGEKGMTKVIMNVAYPNDATPPEPPYIHDHMLFSFFLASQWRELFKMVEAREYFNALYEQQFGWITEDSVVKYPTTPELLLNMFKWWVKHHYVIVDDETRVIKEVCQALAGFTVGDEYDPTRWSLSGSVYTDEKAREEMDAMYTTVRFWRKIGGPELDKKYGRRDEGIEWA